MWFHIICLVIIGTTFTQAQQNDTRTQFGRIDVIPIALNTSSTLKPTASFGQQSSIAKRVIPEMPGGGNAFTADSTKPQQDQLAVTQRQQQTIANDKLVQSGQGGSNIGIKEPGNTRLDQRPIFAGLPQFVNPQFAMWSLPLNKVLQVKNIPKSSPSLDQLAAFRPRAASPRASNAALAMMKMWNEQLRVPNMSLRLRGQRPPNQQNSIPTKPLIQAEQGGGNDSNEEPGSPVQEQVVTLPPKRTSFNPQLAMGSLYVNKMLKPIPINAIPPSFRGASWRVPQPSSISEPLLKSEQGVSNDSNEEPTNPQQEQVVNLPPSRTSFNSELPMGFPHLNNMWTRLMLGRNRNVPFPFQNMLWQGKQPSTPSVQQSQAEQGAGNDSTEEPGGTQQEPLAQLAESFGATNPRAWSNTSPAKKTWAELFHFSNTPLSLRGEQRPVQESSAVTDPSTQPEQGAGDSTEEPPANAPPEKLPNLSLPDRGPVNANALKDALIWKYILARLSRARTSSLPRRPVWPVQYRSTPAQQLMLKLFLHKIIKNARSRNIQNPFYSAGINGRYSPLGSAMNPAMESRLAQAAKLYHRLNLK